MSDVGVVGGGVLGMTLALRLRRSGHSVTVIEGTAATGGLAAPQSIGGFTWDRFYHVILMSDRNLKELLGELGLTDRLRWGNTRTGFYTDGELYSLSTSLEFLRFPPLNLVDKARLAATILYASRIRDGRALEAVPVTEWLGRLSGRRTLERIWIPLLKSKLGENYRQASAAFIWAIIARMYAARRSGLKREMFGYVEGGYAEVLPRLRERLEAEGVQFRCGAAVEAVGADGRPLKDSLTPSRASRSSWRSVAGGPADAATVRLVNGETLQFDDVILTVPCGKAAAMCPNLTAAERSRLNSVVYQGITCASLLLRRPLAGYYVTNITESWVPFTAVVEMTALVDRSAFGGNSLVYLPRYLTQDDPFWQRSDAEVKEEFLAALERMYPDFRRTDVLAFEVSRVREVLAVSTLNYTERSLPPVRTSVEHVFVVNSAQIANGTLNLNETIGLANQKAIELERYLTPSTVQAATS
jgi:protoporphyrinogen oxidase